MTKDQAKQWIDDLLVRVAGHFRRTFIRSAFATFQGFVDANWDAIWAKVPDGATEQAIVDVLFTELKTLAVGEPWLVPLIGMVQAYVDTFFQGQPAAAG